MKWLKLLIPPEWDLWMVRDRVTYLVVTGLIFGLVWLGARQVGEMAGQIFDRLLGR